MTEVDPYAPPKWYNPSSLVRRLGGIYDTPITDGCGPLDGKMVVTRDWNDQFKRPKLHLDTAAMIVCLERGDEIDTKEVELMIEELKKPADPLGICGTLFIVPIHCEAIARLKELLNTDTE